MKKIIISILCLGFSINAYCEKKPKLVIGIVIDQMRYDYIYRFWDDFGEKGFKRLVNQGFFFRNANFSYVPTYTGPGHASIYTGTTPQVHGIIANNWYDKSDKKSVYCAQDDNVHIIGADKNKYTSNMSPRRMLTTTIGDELKLFSNAKVIGISLKDRGAVLPAGHSANAAFWMNSDGRWVSSSYYMQELPAWLKEINAKDNIKQYMRGSWEMKDHFSHNLDTMFVKAGPSSIKKTPFGNTILKDLAISILEEEELGKGAETDFLSISFSTTDYIGHQYGPHAPEIFDTYIHLDKDIAQLLKALDNKIGSESILVFLTADHGVVSQPNDLIKKNIPAGYFDKIEMINSLKEHLNNKIGEGKYILNFSNNQLFLDYNVIDSANLRLKDVQQICADYLINIDGVKNTFTATQMHENEYQNSFHSLIQKGFNQKRSGDVIIVLESGWIDSYWKNGGTTHGSAYSYDTHVPLIFWGNQLKHGRSDRAVYIKDIAPTICTVLGISHPNGCTGEPLQEISE